MNAWIKYAMLLFLISTSTVFGQKVSELESNKKKLQEEIELANKLLKDVKGEKQVSVEALRLLENQITNREQLLLALRDQLNITNRSIKKNEYEVEELEEQLDVLKTEYANLIRYAYKNRNNYDMLLFLFSAESFNDAYKRAKYIQYFSDYKKRQVRAIQATQDSLQLKLDELQEKKKEQGKLVADEEAERDKLEKQRQEQNKIIDGLRGKEQDLRKQINAKQRALEQLEKQIEQAITGAFERDKSSNFRNTPEAGSLSAGFINNRGKLPWPVEKGIVTGKFGQSRHPVLENITINNNGIDIATEKSSTVSAIFDGTVSSIIFNPTFQKAVIVRHGGYFSVYSNLEEVFVVKGDKVKAEDMLGMAYTNPESGKTEVHLEIWKGTTKMNPVKWLKR